MVVAVAVWYVSTAEDRLYDEAEKYLKSGQYQEAIQAFDQFRDRYPESPYAAKAKEGQLRSYTLRARDLAEIGQFADSVSKLKELRKLTSTTPDGEVVDELIVKVYIDWGKTQTSNRNYRDAIETLDGVIADYPKSELIGDAEGAAIQAYILWAHEDLDNLDLTSAIDHYELALTKYSFGPISATAKQELFDLYMKTGSDRLTQAISINGDISVYLEDALKWYREASALEPGSTEANRMVRQLNTEYSLPVYAWQENSLNISQPLSSEVTISAISEEIAVINSSIESSQLSVSLGEDILYSYTFSETSPIFRTVDSIEYSVLVADPVAGIYKVTIQADVYRVNNLLTFSPNIFLETQKAEFFLWIP